ncbi:MAG TPA: hypothetical protein VLA12_01385 [Planctomycetaceae bacterium]|nr:hypothetical protein [Planctomycetaceae bacterium]
MAAPYWLLAAGIGVLILGYFLAAIRGGSDSTFIHERMSDDDILKELGKQKGDPVASFFVIAGYLMILVSIVWRIANKFT